MEAYIVEEAGGNFHETDLPSPTIRPNEVLVRIKTSGVNPLDAKIRAGKAPHAKQTLPAVLGVDMAGVVEEVGSAVTGFRCGDEVYGMVGGVGGLQGTLAEFIGVDADLLAHKPKNLSMRQAAALPLVAITAMGGIDRSRPRLRRSDHTYSRRRGRSWSCCRPACACLQRKGLRYSIAREERYSRVLRGCDDRPSFFFG